MSKAIEHRDKDTVYTKHLTQYQQSHSFLQAAECREAVDTVIKLAAEEKSIKERLAKQRDWVKSLMLKYKCTRVLWNGMTVMVSQPQRSSSTKFDLERFKADHPDLYKQYSYKQGGWGNGGMLSIKPQTDNQAQQYKRAHAECTAKHDTVVDAVKNQVYYTP